MARTAYRRRDGRETLEALSPAALPKNPFGLILLDVNMPDVDGFDVAEQIPLALPLHSRIK